MFASLPAISLKLMRYKASLCLKNGVFLNFHRRDFKLFKIKSSECDLTYNIYILLDVSKTFKGSLSSVWIQATGCCKYVLRFIKHCLKNLGWESNNNRYGMQSFIFTQNMMHEIFHFLIVVSTTCAVAMWSLVKKVNLKKFLHEISLCMFGSQ